jgi:catechol 2,3-dioxygenase-like lactoylglutathione lyase family enzyme
METVISNLLSRFERGALTRREVVQALAMMAAASRTMIAAGRQAGSINHVSVLVGDMSKSVEFYRRTFGLSMVNEDAAHSIVRLGIGQRVLVSLRKEPPAGMVDHFAIGVEGFEKESVTRDLNSLGLTPHENLEYGFYVDDPDGVHVQITGI